MDLLSVTFVLVFGLVFLLSLSSAYISDRLPLSEPLIALGVGALIGIAVPGPLHRSVTQVSPQFLHELAEITLSIALMTTALQVPQGYLRRHWKPVLLLLGLGMPLMWAASSVLTFAVLGLPLWIALFVGGAITPTDPVLASTIVSGHLAEDNIASRLRHLVILESGANDGLAYAFVLLPLNVLLHPLHQAVCGWLLYSVLWEIGGSIIFGAIIGLVAGWLANGAFALRATQHSSFLGLTLTLALLTLGALKLVGTDAILGVFVAGLVFSQTLGYRGHELERAEHVQEAVERFFDLPVFIVLGAVLPWRQWLQMGWSAIILAVLILALRRIPVMLLLTPLLKPAMYDAREALFIGWFGPIGISALFYATLAFPVIPGTTGQQIQHAWPIITLVITASVITHGISATPLTLLFGQHVTATFPDQQQGPQSTPEADPEEQRDRIARDVEDSVRRQVRQVTERPIAAILARRLRPPRARLPVPLRRSRGPDAYGPEIGSEAEVSEEIARQIARDVAQDVAEQAAQAVSERVTQHLRDADNDDDREPEPGAAAPGHTAR